MKRLITRILASFLGLKDKPKAKLALIVLFLCVIGVFLIAEPLLAQDAAATPIKEGPTWTDTILSVIASLAIALAQALGIIITALIAVIIVPIMQYNNFASSAVIGAGWAVIRDAVNMFFVIVLIFIAFGTIFGHEKFKWRQQVTKLLIFAILINFSRTLATIMIDFGQVVMLTFVNALQDIAAGNFIQMLGLGYILDIDPNAGPIKEALAQGTEADPVRPFDMMAASLVAVLMMIIVLVTLCFLVVILVYRIVMLWVLVTVAPLAWFMGGLQGLYSSDAYADWWKMFTCAIAIGPVVTFFLWLALAVAGSGSIAAMEFETLSTESSGTTNVSGSLSQALEPGRLVSFIIGIALIFAGFDAAQKICGGVQGLGGLVGKMSSTGKAIAAKPAEFAATAARITARLPVSAGAAGAGAALWGARKAGAGARGAARLAGSAAGWGYEVTGAGEKVRGAARGAGVSVLESMAGSQIMPVFVRDNLRRGAGKLKAAQGEELGKVQREVVDTMPLDALKMEADACRGKINNRCNAIAKRVMSSSGAQKAVGIEGMKQLLDPKRMKALETDPTVSEDQMKQWKTGAAAALGKKGIENIDSEEKLKQVGSESFKDQDFIDHLGQQMVDIKIKGEMVPMKMLEAGEKGYLGGGVKNKIKDGKEEIAKRSSEGGLVSTPPQNINMNIVRSGGADANFTPQVAAHLVGGGTTAQMQQVAARGELGGQLSPGTEHLKEVKAKAIDGQPNVGKRVQARHNLMTAMGGTSSDAFTEAFDYEPEDITVTNEEGEMEEIKAGTFKDKAAEEDFRASAAKDQKMVKRMAKLGGGHAKIAAGSATRDTMNDLMRERSDPNKSAQEQNDAEQALVNIVEAAEKRVAELDAQVRDIESKLEASEKGTGPHVAPVEAKAQIAEAKKEKAKQSHIAGYGRNLGTAAKAEVQLDSQINRLQAAIEKQKRVITAAEKAIEVAEEDMADRWTAPVDYSEQIEDATSASLEASSEIIRLEESLKKLKAKRTRKG